MLMQTANDSTIAGFNKAACSKCFDDSKHILTDNHHLVIEIFDIALNPRKLESVSVIACT